MDIRQCSVADFMAHPDAPGLRAEYAAESAIRGLPVPAPDAESYALLEHTGAAYFLAAFEGDALLGFFVGLVHTNPHYGVPLGVTESFFVAPRHRKTGAGLALLRKAEAINAERGAKGMFVSAAHGSALSTVLSRVGYMQSNDVFFKSFEALPAVQTPTFRLPATTAEGIEYVEHIDTIVASIPQLPVTTRHTLHAGLYARTICIPAGAVLTGVLVKIPTTLILNGHVSVWIGDGESIELKGHCVLPASAGRKQAYIAHADTHITMLFKTDARTVEAAEAEFTDETDRLFSRYGENEIVVTGD